MNNTTNPDICSLFRQWRRGELEGINERDKPAGFASWEEYHKHVADLQARVGELLDQWEKRYEQVYDKDGLTGPEMLRDCIDDLKRVANKKGEF